MAVPKLFTLKDGNIVINKIELLAYKPFKEILYRDKGKLTRYGKVKDIAFKELFYIYIVADVRSLPNRHGKKESEVIKYALDKSGLSNVKGWQPDEYVLEAIELYKNEQEHIGKSVIAALLKTFKYTEDVTIKVRSTIDKMLNGDTLSVDQAKEVISLIEIIISLSKDIPQLIKNLDKAISELNKSIEEDNVPLLRGTTEHVPISADPDRDFA